MQFNKQGKTACFQQLRAAVFVPPFCVVGGSNGALNSSSRLQGGPQHAACSKQYLFSALKMVFLKQPRGSYTLEMRVTFHFRIIHHFANYEKGQFDIRDRCVSHSSVLSVLGSNNVDLQIVHDFSKEPNSHKRLMCVARQCL